MRLKKRWGLWKSRVDAKWRLYRPGETDEVEVFDSFPYGYKPDCKRFLDGYCHCRFECAR